MKIDLKNLAINYEAGIMYLLKQITFSQETINDRLHTGFGEDNILVSGERSKLVVLKSLYDILITSVDVNSLLPEYRELVNKINNKEE